MSRRLLPVLLGSGLVLLAAAGPAFAATSPPPTPKGKIDKVEPAKVTSYGALSAGATANGLPGCAQLRVQALAEATSRFLDGANVPDQGRTLSGATQVAVGSWNGVWTVQLYEPTASSTSSTSSPRCGTSTAPPSGSSLDVTQDVAVEVPPAAPTGVAAKVTKAGVRVQWKAGPEPDLTGYRVQEGDKVLASTTCDAKRTPACVTGADLARVAPGRHTYTVTAVRACPTCPAGPLAAFATIKPVVVAAPASPTPSPSSSPTGGSGSASAPRLLPSDANGGLAPGLPLPPLAPAPPQVAPTTSPPLPDGTYSPRLDYPSAAPADDSSVLQEQAAPAPVQRSFWSSLDGEHLARSVATALVLFLFGAHLRRWASSSG